MGGARLSLGPHKKKRFVIVLRYDGEQEKRGLILSLLTDYAVLFHPEQKALFKHLCIDCEKPTRLDLF